MTLLVDAIGQTFAPLSADAAQHARIACLVPSITELLFALNLGDQLVARTGFCIHPAAGVEHIPKVGGTKDVQLEKLRALSPTHCIVNVDENTKSLVPALREFVPHIIVTHPQHPADNLALFELLGAIFHRQAEATSLHQQLSATLHSAAEWRGAIERRNVLYLIWRKPWMTVARDTYISQLLALLKGCTLPAVNGGDGIATAGASRYPKLDFTESWLSQVHELWLSSEPYRFDETHVDEVTQLMQAHNPQARVRLVDGELLSWYGLRASDGIHYLHQLIQS